MFFTTYAAELWEGLRRVASRPAKSTGEGSGQSRDGDVEG